MLRHCAAVSLLLACPGSRHGDSCSNLVATDGTCTRGVITETAVDGDPSMVRVHFEYAWHRDPGLVYSVDWTVPKTRLGVVRAPNRDKVNCQRLVAGPRCGAPASLVPDTEALAFPEPTLEDRDRICPRDRVDDTTPLLGSAALLAAFGERSGDWERTNAHRAGVADAVYIKGAQQAHVSIEDMIRVCTGDGPADDLLDTEEIRDPKSRRSRVSSATSAVLIQWNDTLRAKLVMWIANRCRVSIEMIDEINDWSELTIVGKAVDVELLEKLCGRR